MLALVYLKSHTQHCNTTPTNTPKYYAIISVPY
jgi:hypothetical protein